MNSEFCLSPNVSRADVNQFVNLIHGKPHKQPVFSQAVNSDHFSWRFHKEYAYLIHRKTTELNKCVLRSLKSMYFYADLLILALPNCENIVTKVKVMERLFNLSNLRGDYLNKYEKIQEMLDLMSPKSSKSNGKSSKSSKGSQILFNTPSKSKRVSRATSSKSLRNLKSMLSSKSNLFK